ncbi:MAG: PilZ domain-containing protein [Desulfobulbus sp.]
MNEKLVRCQCGTSIFIRFDRRSHPREPICRLGSLIFPQNFSIDVFLCDFSVGGVSFICSERVTLMMTTGLNIRIQYRADDGNIVLREIRIKNSRENRVGAQFYGLPVG